MVNKINKSEHLWKAKEFDKVNIYTNLRKHSLGSQRNKIRVNPKKYYFNLMNLKQPFSKKNKIFAHAKISTRFLDSVKSDSDLTYSGIIC